MGVQRAIQLGAFLGPNEPRGVVGPRRGSNSARIRVIGMVHHGRAEIFALPFADTPIRPPGFWLLSLKSCNSLNSLDSFSLLTSKKRSARLANSQLLLHYTDSEVRC